MNTHRSFRKIITNGYLIKSRIDAQMAGTALRTTLSNALSMCLMILSCLLASAIMTSCTSIDTARGRPDTQSEQQSSVFSTILPSLLDCLAAQQDEWNYDKIAEICAIGNFDEKSSWKTSWEKRDNLPFKTGVLFKSHVMSRPGQPLLPSGCFLGVSQNHSLSLALYAQLLGINEEQLNKSLAENDKFINSRYKNLILSAHIDNGCVSSIIISYEPRER